MINYLYDRSIKPFIKGVGIYFSDPSVSDVLINHLKDRSKLSNTLIFSKNTNQP